MSKNRHLKNHTGSAEGVRRTKLLVRCQIFGMLVVGGGIAGLLVYLSLKG